MLKIRRNDPCPCGSGLKYKNCCMNKSETSVSTDFDQLAKEYQKRYKIRLKGPKDIDAIRRAGDLTMDILNAVEKIIEPGISTEKINHLVHKMTIEKGAIPAPLNYKGFPKSVCTSVNSVVCHGIPGDDILQDGDIINVDVTPILNGYYADASKTYFVGTPDDDARKIVSVARECLKLGLDEVKPGNTIGDIGWAIQQYAEKEHCSVVREFIGHGVGFGFHEAPEVPHYGFQGEGIPLTAGMVFTVEPMINLKDRYIYILPDKWTVKTRDGSLSAQFEQTIVVTETGYESLTPYSLDN